MGLDFRVGRNRTNKNWEKDEARSVTYHLPVLNACGKTNGGSFNSLECLISNTNGSRRTRKETKMS